LGAGKGKCGASSTAADWRLNLETSSWSETWTRGGRCEVRILGGSGFMRDVRMAIRKSKSSGDTVLGRIGEGGLEIPAKTVMKSDGAAVSGGLYVPTVGQQPVICRIFSAGCTNALFLQGSHCWEQIIMRGLMHGMRGNGSECPRSGVEPSVEASLDIIIRANTTSSYSISLLLLYRIDPNVILNPP